MDRELTRSGGLASSAPPRKPRLLVVDDQPVNIQALYQVFAPDHQVFMATGGEQALELCTTKRPDLVLLDVVMPGLDGFAVLAELKANPDTRDIPVIFVTAQDDEEAESRGLDLGAVDFITKPIKPKTVRARVRTQLTLKHQADLLRRWVYLDGLTGVFNRRHFDSHFDEECGRAVRKGTPIALLMLDVDHFKRYNDSCGHQAGDECLRRVAGLLASELMRPGDLLARYGGEEFVALLPDTDLDGALEVGRRLASRVREAAIAHPDSSTGPGVTVSIGAAAWALGSPAGPQRLLAVADEQLYRAKSEGRDRVCGSPA